MRRRAFLLASCMTLAGGACVAPFARAQKESAPRRVGVLRISPTDVGQDELQSLRDGFKERGHVEGQDIVIDYRSAEGRPEALPRLGAEIAALKPSVIVAAGTVAVRAMRAAAPDVPIVALAGDFTAAGFAAEFRRPGSGVTGISFLASNLDSKRLELLAELLPKGSAVLNLSDSSAGAGTEKSLEAAGRSLKLLLHSAEARTQEEIEMAFVSARRLKVAGVNVLSSPFLHANRRQIIELAAAAKLPTIYQWIETAEQGGLMAYGPRLTMLYRQLAGLASRILQGARPADLPVEQPTKIELVINLKTAKALGLTIPQSLLLRADEVIQ